MTKERRAVNGYKRDNICKESNFCNMTHHWRCPELSEQRRTTHLPKAKCMCMPTMKSGGETLKEEKDGLTMNNEWWQLQVVNRNEHNAIKCQPRKCRNDSKGWQGQTLIVTATAHVIHDKQNIMRRQQWHWLWSHICENNIFKSMSESDKGTPSTWQSSPLWMCDTSVKDESKWTTRAPRWRQVLAG